MALKAAIAKCAKNLALSLIKSLAPTTATYLGRTASAGTSVTVFMSGHNRGPHQFGNLLAEGESFSVIYPLQQDSTPADIVPERGDKLTIASDDYSVQNVRDLTEGEGQVFELQLVGEDYQYLGEVS